LKVIAVLNQKGGAGKTTIATHLAVALWRSGHSVTLIDSDPQGSARDWAAVRSRNHLPVLGIDRPVIDREIRAIAEVDYVIIDGAPQMTELAVSAIKAAHLILIPVQPSPYDIWATEDLVDLVKARMDITDGRLRAGFVVSRAIRGTLIGRDIIGMLEKHELPILETVIHQRVAYATTAITGETVLDAHPGTEASEEVLGMMRDVLAMAN
jgi:chromosome partitioning protein